MSLHAGIEALDFTFNGQHLLPPFKPVLVGVVGSGNLEVMLESDLTPTCNVHIQTSARGFAPIWQAVVQDFHSRHALAGVRVSIHDMGATPAVVSLRLDQAVAELPPSAPPSGGPP